MPMCSIKQCSARKNKNQPTLTHHRLPRKHVLRQKWLDAIGADNINLRHKEQVICSLHFEDSQFNRTLDIIRLRDNAVPCVFNMLSKDSHPQGAKISSEAVTKEELVACRACLAADGRLYPISGSGLEDVLAALTGVEMPEAEGFPRHLCVFCMARLSKCAAFRDSCRRSTELLRTLVEEELLTMKNIKMVDRQTHKLTNGLTLAGLYHFQTHPVLDIIPPLSENQNKHKEDKENKEEVSEYTEVEYLDIDDGAEYLDTNDSKAAIDKVDDKKVESVNKNSDLNSDDVDDVEYEPENDISDVDTDTLEKALVAIERERKSVKPDKDIARYREVNENAKTKVYKYPSDVDIDTSEETTEIRRIDKKALAAFSKNFNFTVKVLNKEQQRQKVEERKRNSRSAFCCDLCGKGFRRKSAVMKHLSYHDPNLAHECEACRLRFRSRLKMLKHRRSHRAVYTCNECGYTTRFRTYAKNHSLMHKGTTYSCPYCYMVYNYQTSYYNHIRMQHPGQYEACDECGETFAAGRGITLHKSLVHGTSDKPNGEFKCKDCDVKFSSGEALQRHLELGAGVPHAALWPCAACGDTCGSETALKHHAAEEHSDRHHCDECNKTFLNSESFELHVQRKHMNKRAVLAPFRPRVGGGGGRSQPCVCEICGKVLRNSTLLQYHINGHLPIKPFRCTQCPKTFPRQAALDSHMRVHTGERPFQCEQCPQAFASPSNLSRHTKYRHMTRELVKCKICDKQLRAVSLSLHVRTVHQNVKYVRKRDRKRKRVVAET